MVIDAGESEVLERQLAQRVEDARVRLVDPDIALVNALEQIAEIRTVHSRPWRRLTSSCSTV